MRCETLPKLTTTLSSHKHYKKTDDILSSRTNKPQVNSIKANNEKIGRDLPTLFCK